MLERIHLIPIIGDEHQGALPSWTVQLTVDPFHLGSVFALRQLLDAADPNEAPSLRTLRPLPRCSSIALLPGSFNPPTAAHMLLAERARSEGFDAVIFLLARQTSGKAHFGLALEDRLMALHAMASGPFGVGVCSHGLYADQAAAASRAFAGAEISFLVGSDKVLQIFDDTWYPDRDAALRRLFDVASVIVAPRSDQSEALADALAEDRNRAFADRIEVLRLHPAVGDLSSTRVRGLLRSGADPNGLVPPVIADLIEQTRAFASPIVLGNDEVDAYDIRVRLIDLIWRTHGMDGASIDLTKLVRIALSATEPGRRLRSMLADDTACAADLDHAMAAGA